jgi:Sap-like sulfolipid-1-addressing protein
VSWVDAEFALVALAAMLSPLTLMWSVLAVVLARRPLSTGLWFYLGALVATLAVGAAAAFVLGNAAASHDPSTPKTWVAVIDLIAGLLLLAWVVKAVAPAAGSEKAGGNGREDAGRGLVARGRDLRRRRRAGESGRVHSACTEDDLRVEPVEVDVLPALDRFRSRVAAAARNSDGDARRRPRLGGTDPHGCARLADRARPRVIGAAIVIVLAAALLRGGIAGLVG